MALNIVSNPADNLSSNDPIVWKFQFDSLGSAPNVLRMLYYLADGSGNKISETYHWIPKSTAEIKDIDVKELTNEFTSTAFPSCSTGITTDSNAVKAIKLYYCIASFNTSTGVDTIPSYSQVSVKLTWNTAMNVDTASLLDWSGGRTGMFMNSYPKRMKWSIDGEPYGWFAGVGSIRITWYTSTGSTILSVTHTITGATTAKYVSFDWRCHSISKPHSALIEINEGLGYQNYIVSYDACTCRGFYTGLTFLDPLGGRSHVAINCPAEISLERNGSEVIRYGETAITKGRSFFNPSLKEKVKFIIPLGTTAEDLTFAKALIGSPGHHILKMSDAGVKTWYKFILNTGESTIIKGKEIINIELSGVLADDKSGQKIDI